MGIDVRVESENGDVEAELPDVDDLTEGLLPSFDDSTSPCLRFVDRYGDTTFNGIQLPLLIAELRKVLGTVRDAERLRHGHDMLRLAEQACSAPHWYLKFYGD
jgi:hypothetical protein